MAASVEAEVIACHKPNDWDAQLNASKETKKLLVVDFTASWCPPCRFIAPFFVELAKKYLNAIFVKVDVDELRDVSREYAVEAMPTFMFLKDGKVLEKVVGADKVALENTLVKHYEVATTSA